MPQPVPKYRWIADQLARSIHVGQYTNGDKLPAQRQMAKTFGVTIGTITHAYAELERRGLVTARRGDGTYVNCAEQTLDQHAPINMAFNVPTPDEQEVTALQETLVSIAKDAQACREMLDYPSELGLNRHREALAQWLMRLGTAGQSQRLMLTHGAQHALACVLRNITRPGDVLLTEVLSYHGLQPLAQELRLQIIGVGSDAQGLLPQDLERAVRIHHAKALYCIPSLQMPTGSTMSLQRRQDIAVVAKRNHLLVIEDVVHALGQVAPLPALSTWLPEQSFLIGSFSKSTSPALRVGFVEADPKWLGKLALAMRADCLTTSPLLSEVLVRWMHNGVLAQLMRAQREEVGLRQREACAMMVALSKRHGLALKYSSDTEFPFIWLTLPADVNAEQLATHLQTRGVLVRSSDHFKMGRSSAPAALRISLSSPKSRAELVRGLLLIIQAVINCGSAMAEDQPV